MMKQNVNVDQWTDLFASINLSEATMHRWHELFEARHPEGHQGFLEWLGLDQAKIGRIRQCSRDERW